MGIYMGTRRYTLVHGFCFFKLFLMVGKELKSFSLAAGKQEWPRPSKRDRGLRQDESQTYGNA